MAKEMELVESGTESGGGVSGGVTPEIAPVESQETEDRQPEVPAVPEIDYNNLDYSKVDLSKTQQFQEHQRRTDQRFEQMRQEAEQLRADARAARMEGMDDFEKVSFERDGLRADNENLQQTIAEERQMQEALQYRNRQAQEISQKSGVPIDKLDLSSPDAAWSSAFDYMRSNPQGATAASEEPAASVAPNVDLGGGGPQTRQARERATWNQMKKQGATAQDMYRFALGAPQE